MLTPNDGSRIVILPQDREIMEITGMSEAEYRAFARHCKLHCKVRPGDPTAFLIIPFLIQLVIGIVLSVLASLIMRPRQKPAPQINTANVDGQNIVDGSRYAPKSGFDSVQNVVELGSVVPLIYAKRETINGKTYGGVRVNTNLLWSQIYSLGGSQMLRALFLVSEASVEGIDPLQFAIGNNLLGSYDLSTTNNQSSRIAIYYSPDGGRLRSTDYVAGRRPDQDVGNAENNGGPDVFAVRGVNNDWSTDFCYVSKPSNQTRFGVYSFIGNGFAYRVNPRFSPQVSPRVQGKNYTLYCPLNHQEVASRQKVATRWSGRGGLVAKNSVATSVQDYSLAVGDVLTYSLLNSSDAAVVFTSANDDGPNGEETCRDIAQNVASRQRGWDDSITVGELYKIGSALAVCSSRSPQDAAFASEIDNEPVGGGQAITAQFRVIRAGRSSFTSNAALVARAGSNATQSSHIFRAAIASFIIDRPSQVVEIGLRSAVGASVNGLCNFRDCRSYERIDNDACLSFSGRNNSQNINTTNFSSGTYSGSETRYSFFRLGYRVAGTDDAFTQFEPCFGIRSQTQQATYNYLRIEFPAMQRWEFEIEPLTGWEIRNNIATGGLEILDPQVNSVRTVQSQDCVIRFSGVAVARSADTFYMSCLKPGTGADLGNGLDDGTDYADAWARLAEAFIYSEMSSSASGQPEHEVVYINTISPNPTVPNYDNLALVGMNIRASTEFNQLSQFSVYVNSGLVATHLFPEVLYDLMTNARYGTGEILSSKQINKDSFELAAQWCRSRRYFFDGAVSQKINLRSWGAEKAGDFLLDLVVRNGRFALQPVAQFDSPEQITGMFTAGNILEESFSLNYVDQEARQAPRVSVKWREEKQSTDAANRGLFPVIREVTVREASTPEDAPLEQIDMSEFCTSEIHAIDRAKLACRQRRLTTHGVKFKTTPDQAALDLGRVFKLGMETLTYEQPSNGAIALNGAVTSWPALADGHYAVLLYDGQTNAIQETTIDIYDGRSSQYHGSVFCLQNSANNAQTYKVTSLSFDEEGNIDVEALFHPTDESDYSMLTKGWNVDGNWIIEGALGDVDSPVDLDPTFNGVQITGPATATAGTAYTYAAVVDGTDGSYAYAWTGGGTASTKAVTFAAPSAGVTSYASTLQVSVTLNGVSRQATKTITVFAAPAAPSSPTFQSARITGPSTTTAGTSYTYTAEVTGPSGSYTYLWSAGGTASTKAMTFAAPDAGSTSYVYELQVTVSLGGVTRPASKLITVLA
jgi:hypothetical protein